MKKIIKTLAAFLLAICVLMPVVTVNAAEATTPTGIPLSQISDRIDALVANYMADFTPGFAVAVVHDGEIVFTHGYGSLDTSRGTAVIPEMTVFEYGSIGKLFVYISVMQLVEQGLLDLDAPVGNYLPEDLYRQFDFRMPFTTRDLLNHSAGFSEFMFGLFLDPGNVQEEITLRDGLLASRPPQIFTPGTASSYSNFGSALTAYIVTYVSGRDFTSYERANILDPLGMTNTRNQPDWFAALADVAFEQNKARGHMPMPFGAEDFMQVPWAYIPIYPAGSLRGTAEDLAQLAIALMPPEGEPGPLFESRDTLDLMLSPSFDRGVFRGTHHGFMTYDAVAPALGHSGGTMGFNADFVIVPSERFGVVLLTNANGGANFMEIVMDMLIGNTRDAVPAPTGNLPDASIFAGNYLMLRRNVGNIMEIANPMMAGLSVEAVDANTIDLNVMGMTLTYRQVEPYVFRIIDAGGFIGRVGYELEFLMEDGVPVGISLSAPFDATRQTFTQSLLFVIISEGIMALSGLFFFVMTIIILVKYLRKKEEASSFRRLSNGLVLSGALLSANTGVMIVRMILNPMGVQTSMVTFHAWFTWVFAAAAIALMVASVLFFTKNKIDRSRKIIYFSSVAVMVIYLVFLWNGNMFVIM